ncbi:hypothetical protein CJD36_015600 [Flavipsychrobacter stenotrophus]|uniref:Schlafen group 3-like DNA/RNA helicase domain-containing protein n=1 Tax=Flavipsychrobacter stenotrophus TaxID=2077091 RepID=A0A2S7ST71_9BACT|nr:DNA/RNA helicase domain-containing protein [Flavipsychrobacter stenotrophus]PQJ10120.1 hypothetical protein CJD36_015600 [Flavipsychrobacter stenotrophus]
MSQAYYGDNIKNLLLTETNSIKGLLHTGATEHPQMWTIQSTSWESSIDILKKQLSVVCSQNREAENWAIFLEYEVPRLLSRIDAVIIARDLIFVIEFKYDRKTYELADVRQVEDYSLDLKDFHLQSRNRIIVPILLCPLAKGVSQKLKKDVDNLVQPVVKANAQNLAELIISSFNANIDSGTVAINANEWGNSVYSPTPTIIQAAQALFAGQKVEAITNRGAENLSYTTDYIVEVIKAAQINKNKIVCFVTGVPGAGKTLVGLNVIHKEEFIESNKANAAYFSGNGPLVSVLREALTRDELERESVKFKNKLIAAKPSKSVTETKVGSKIQNLHQFIKACSKNALPPDEHIVVFDEAQRCWNAENVFRQARRSRVDEDRKNAVQISEAETIFEIMDRHSDWSVIIALVGNGQEINTGEAGIGEWGDVLKNKYTHWHVHISPELLSGKSLNAINKLFDTAPDNLKIIESNCLHLSVSQRSFKANNLNDWVNAVLDNNPVYAKELYSSINENYPIAITRDLDKAKAWLKGKKQGNKRTGLVASSGAMRLRSYGINTREEIDVPYWFLNDEGDVRSSYYLEVIATEYKIQGLEIDWIGVCWDGDLRRDGDRWDYRKFKGTNWENVHEQSDRQFLLNKYRVLLTRAREGMVIWIPLGVDDDVTRLPTIYNPIFAYFKSCGVEEI